jgi:two-component system response regulator AtoC
MSNGKTVLFIPPPDENVASVEPRFREEGIRFGRVENHQELLLRLKTLPPFLLVFDLSRWDGSISTVLPELEGSLGDCKTILFGQDGDIPTLPVELLKDMVCCHAPLDATALHTALGIILREGWGVFRRDCILRRPYHLLFCHSNKMEKVKAIVDQVAPTDITVLIEGESGTGKELVARAIHFKSLRRHKPFVKVNCAAIPSDLLESELFGFEKGVFTGAHIRKPGKFELANEGTIFLDEIADLHTSLQAKLVQVLQGGGFSRLGGKENVAIDARFIACTKFDLREAMEIGRFREDLYYRLNVVRIPLLPLRERKEEILSLAKYFLNLYNYRYGRSRPRLPKETDEAFLSCDWPGNVRQLKDMIKRMVVFEEEDSVVRELSEGGQRAVTSSTHVSHSLHPFQEERSSLKDVGKRAAKEAERAIIRQMLTQTRWNRRKTALLLQISYKALLYKIKEYGLGQ